MAAQELNDSDYVNLGIGNPHARGEPPARRGAGDPAE